MALIYKVIESYLLANYNLVERLKSSSLLASCNW